uniref:SH2 domain-containing protein n=1 Tax=Parastrongyloides trichosuri TaxID=131310 RepID=A0A0N4Z0J6_PARTI
MSEFLDFQAEESDISHDSSDSDTLEPKIKKAKKIKERKKRRTRISDDDDEEEEDDDRKIEEEMKGFVVNELSDDEEQEKSEESDSDLDEELSEDDIDLVNDNLGLRTGGRIQVMDEDDDIYDQRIRNNNRESDINPSIKALSIKESYSPMSDSEDMDDFISDAPRNRRNDNALKRSEISRRAMEEVTNVFGKNASDDSQQYSGEENEYVSRNRKKSNIKKSIALDPSDMIISNMTDEAQRIVSLDVPERYVCCKRPIEKCTAEEISNESVWIYENVLNKKPLTQIEAVSLVNFRDDEDNLFEDEKEYIIKGIGIVLGFIHNQKYEIPFIYNYRHECFNISGHKYKFTQNDLWGVYFADKKYWNFMDRKKRLKDIMFRMERFVAHESGKGSTNIRSIDNNDYSYVDSAMSDEALDDIRAKFYLIYGQYLNKMYLWENNGNDVSKRKNQLQSNKYKICLRSGFYDIALSCNLYAFAEKFGLTVNEIASNCTTRYDNPLEARHTEIDPVLGASSFICENFPSEKHVIDGSVYLLAKELSCHPDFRQVMRLEFEKSAKITMSCTSKGKDVIQPGHPLYKFRYCVDKPVESLKDDEFLHIINAEKEGFVKFEIHVSKKCKNSNSDNVTFIDNFINKKVFHVEKISEVAKEWNKLRSQVLIVAVEKFLTKIFIKDLTKKLIDEASTLIIDDIRVTMDKKFYKKGFQVDLQDDEDEDDEESIRHGVRIMSIVTSTKNDETTTAVLLDGEGNLLDMDIFPYISNRFSEGPKRYNPNGKTQSEEKLKEYIIRKKPHAIVLAADNLDSLRIETMVKELCLELKNSKCIRRDIHVKLVDPDVSIVFCYSEMAEIELSGQTFASKQAISLGRYFIDPLVEMAHLFNHQKDFLKLKIHPLQNIICKELFVDYVIAFMMNYVNKVGVDVNRCIEQDHAYNMLQFVCGLGPVKASHIKKAILTCDTGLATSRAALITVCGLGPNIYMNSSPFIKIDTAKVKEMTNEVVNDLDCTRIHPEHYSLAAKIASEALDVDFFDDESEICEIIEKISKNPQKLDDLNKDSIIQTLSESDFGDSSFLVPLIINELGGRYADPRKQSELSPEERFKLLIHEDIESYQQNKLISASFKNLVYKRLQDKDIERPNGFPVKGSNFWKCRFCGRETFNNSKEVIEHVTNIGCPGVITGLRGELTNGLNVFVSINKIIDGCDNYEQDLDKEARHELNRKLDEAKRIANNIKKGSQLTGRILGFQKDKFCVQLSCRPCDLEIVEDNPNDLDEYFDLEAFRNDYKDDNKKPKVAEIRYVKRIITHGQFYNVSFKEAETILEKRDPGDSIFRPSSRFSDHLCITWKVSTNVYQHVDIIEKNKPQVFSIGRTLTIGDEDYEDLEEILARFIQPMARLSRFVLDHKYYNDGIYAEDDEKLNQYLRNEKLKNNNRIPYIFVSSQKYPGKFVIAYQPRDKMYKEYFSVKPDGYRFRQRMFQTLDLMMKWFKTNFNKPQKNNKGNNN